MRNIQASGNLYGKYITLVQISKPAARKLFAKGETIYLQSCNMHPFGLWQSVCPIQFSQESQDSDLNHIKWCIDNGLTPPDTYTPDSDGQFNQHCNNYGYYNLDSQRGNYITFYKQI